MMLPGITKLSLQTVFSRVRFHLYPCPQAEHSHSLSSPCIAALLNLIVVALALLADPAYEVAPSKGCRPVASSLPRRRAYRTPTPVTLKVQSTLIVAHHAPHHRFITVCLCHLPNALTRSQHLRPPDVAQRRFHLLNPNAWNAAPTSIKRSLSSFHRRRSLQQPASPWLYRSPYCSRPTHPAAIVAATSPSSRCPQHQRALNTYHTALSTGSITLPTRTIAARTRFIVARRRSPSLHRPQHRHHSHTNGSGRHDRSPTCSNTSPLRHHGSTCSRRSNDRLASLSPCTLTAAFHRRPLPLYLPPLVATWSHRSLIQACTQARRDPHPGSSFHRVEG